MIRFATATLLSGLLLLPANAQDWPQFRGANFGGVSYESKALPTTWDIKENILWSTPLPARGISSPVIVEDRIYLTANSGYRHDKLHVLCLDKKSGKLLWQREMMATGNTGSHPKTNMSAPTPVADANGVYALFATADLVAFDKDGTLRWYRSLVGDYPNIGNQVGMASSPVLANNTLIVPMDNAGDSFIAGIDPRYGNNIWKTPRDKDINWTTPLTMPAKFGTQVLMVGTKDTISYNPETGKENWKMDTGRAGSASPSIAGDKVLIPAAGVTAVQVTAADKTNEIWKSLKLSGGYTSPIYFQDRIYSITGSNVLVCGDAQTGKEIWQERIKSKGKFWASPIIGDGKLYLFDELGVGTVAKLGDKPEILATNDLKEEIMGTPAISDGCLFIRTDKAIYCVGSK